MIIKKNFVTKVPDRIPLANGINRDSFNWSISVFYDDSWVGSGDTIDYMFRCKGDGATQEYNTNSIEVTSCIAQGMVLISTNYEGVSGSKSPWIHGNGSNPYFPQQYFIRNSIEIQSALEVVVDTVQSDINIPIRDIYMIGQSRGGTSILAWSSNCRTDDFRKYSEMVKGIIANVPTISSQSPNQWRQPFMTHQSIQYAINNRRHTEVIVLNDSDSAGTSDYRNRIQYALSERNKTLLYFYNFPEQGHETDLNFNYSILNQWRNGVKDIEYNDKKLTSAV